MPQVYLDHQSATPVAPEVFEAMKPYFSEAFGSPSSLHQHGWRAREALSQARAQIARLINAASPEEILFTSGGTESANLAVKGAAYAAQRQGTHIVLSAVEHPAVLRSVEFLQKQGFTSTLVGVDAEGRVDPQAVAGAITDRTSLVCVHHVNHDIGTIEPIREIGQIAAERGVTFFADASASGGWLPIDVQAMGVQLLSLSPHRFYGPKGVGILYRSRQARLAPVMHGGMQEDGRRAGTENVPAIVGAGAAAELTARELPARLAHTAELQQRLWQGLVQAIPRLHLNGPTPGPTRLPINLNVSPEFIEGEGLMLLCDMQGVAFASGTACVSKTLKTSHVLQAVGASPESARAAILLSIGRSTTAAQIDQAVAVLAKATAKLRAMSPAWAEFQQSRSTGSTSPAKRGKPRKKGKVVSVRRSS